MSQRRTHPFIMMLVQILDEIRILALKGEFAEAYNTMLTTVYFLRVTDQEKGKALIESGVNNLNYIKRSQFGPNWQRRRLQGIEAENGVKPKFYQGLRE